MAFSDTCIETLVELCMSFVHYGKHGELDAVLPRAVQAIHDLAEMASILEYPAIPNATDHRDLLDGFFLGNLLDAVTEHDDPRAVQFLAAAAHSVPVLGAALLRYEQMLRGKAGTIYGIRKPEQAETLQKVLLAYQAAERTSQS